MTFRYSRLSHNRHPDPVWGTTQSDQDGLATTGMMTDDGLAYPNDETQTSQQTSETHFSQRSTSTNPPSPSFATCGQVPNQTGKSEFRRIARSEFQIGDSAAQQEIRGNSRRKTQKKETNPKKTKGSGIPITSTSFPEDDSTIWLPTVNGRSAVEWVSMTILFWWCLLKSVGG